MSFSDDLIAADQMKAGLDKLPAMLEEMRQAPSIVRPSRFWEHYNELNLRQLADGGFAEFKRTVNRNYFQFQLVAIRSPQYRAAISAWLKHPRPAVFGARLAERIEFDPHAVGRIGQYGANKAYAVYIALLWEYVRSRDLQGVLGMLDEPLVGCPSYIDYRGHRVSEDLCNSALEYTAIADAIPAGESVESVIELGAGYGRVAWVFLSALPNVRYTIVDIPPALAVAEQYLSDLFPDRRVFGFRHFDDYADVTDEFEAAQIVFMTPNQLDLIPPQRADLFVNVSSLHEMRPEQIEHYFTTIQSHCDGRFYTKQWLRSVNPRDGVVVSYDDYPVPTDWRPIFDRTHPIQVEFFETLYQLNDKSTSQVT
jgi:putative sugar O-methyltransferase